MGKVCLFPFFPHGEKRKKKYMERERNECFSLSFHILFSHFSPWGKTGKMGKDTLFPWAKMGLAPLYLYIYKMIRLILPVCVRTNRENYWTDFQNPFCKWLIWPRTLSEKYWIFSSANQLAVISKKCSNLIQFARVNKKTYYDLRYIRYCPYISIVKQIIEFHVFINKAIGIYTYEGS